MNQVASQFADFRWSFSTLGCPALTLEECCALSESYGIASIEARTLESTADLPRLFEVRYGSREELARYLGSQSASIDFLDTSLKLVGNDSVSRNEFLKFIPWAEAIRAKWLRVFDGGTVSDRLDAESFEEANDTLDWWTALKNEKGWKVDIAIETHDSLVHATARSQLLDAIRSPIAFIWDSHHTWKKANEPISVSWNQIKDLVVNVHIKDSISIASARHPFTYVQLGEGEFPLNEVLSLLDGDSYEGNVSIEWERQWHPYLPPLETALSKAKEFAWF